PARRPGPTPRRAHVRRCPSLPSPGSSWPSSGPVRKSDGFRTPLAAAWTHPSVLDVPGAHLRTPGGPSRRPATPDDPPDLRTRPLAPERCPRRGAALVEPEVDVVAVPDGRVDVLLEVSVLGVARRVGAEVLRAGAPVRAVPDDLLDPHAAREGVRVAFVVGGQEQVDQAARLAAVGRVRDVEMPV